MIACAATEAGICVSTNELDKKGHYLGVKNGILDLRVSKFKLVQDQPEYFISKSCNVVFDPDAPCDNWIEFLETIFEGDYDVINFMQLLVGSSLFGHRKTKLALLYGYGANGKSTFTDTLHYVLGDYASTSDASALLGERQNVEYYLTRLRLRPTSHGVVDPRQSR